LVPNAAYLVHSVATTNYTWTIKGRPTVPSYLWSSTGINLIGFPTVSNSPPFFDKFLALVPDFALAIQLQGGIYQYVGGELGVNNPSDLAYLSSVTRVTRGQAFWIRSGTYYNNYFGPFQVSMDSRGADFGDANSLTSFHLRNTSIFPTTVTLKLLPSETAPGSQPAVLGVPPLLVRGALSSNLLYSAATLTTASTSSVSWTLPAKGKSGSDIVVILGVDRVAFANSTAGMYAGILKFTDSSNMTEVDVSVSAQPAAYAGLWVGQAEVSQVASYLKTYARDSSDKPIADTNGTYIVTSTNTTLGDTASSFPLRLILHNTGSQVKLLQRVFYGADIYTNTIVTTSESRLDPAQRSNARRITSVQLPWTPNNNTWTFDHALAPGATLSTEVDMSFDDQAANPFLHTFHPDHDNLDRTVTPPKQLKVGMESYNINRHITLTVNSVGSDFDSLTQFGQTFQGGYSESITMLGINGAPRTFNVQGQFLLNRISPIAVLTGP
jgi:hypothetical protein